MQQKRRHGCFGLYQCRGFGPALRAGCDRWLDALDPAFLSIPAGELTPILYFRFVCQKIRFATSGEYFASSSWWICKINKHHLQQFWATPLEEEPLRSSCITQKLNAPTCAVAKCGVSHQSSFVSFWKSLQKVTMPLCKDFFSLFFSLSHNWFVPHNELFILWKWFSGQASWSDMVIATSTGQNLPYRIPFSNYRGSNEERKDENNSQMMENLERVLSIFVDIVEQTGSIFFLESILLTASQILKLVPSTQVSYHDKVEVCISIIHRVATSRSAPLNTQTVTQVHLTDSGQPAVCIVYLTCCKMQFAFRTHICWGNSNKC